MKLLKQWESEATVISVSQYYFLSQVYYVLEDFKMVLQYIDTVIKEAALANLEMKESWYKTKLSAYYELQDFQNMKKTLVTLIVNWPAPGYWWQLSSTYNELNDEPAFFASTEVIYQSGYFDKPTQQKLFNRFYELLAPGGYLFLGHSEQLGEFQKNFTLLGKTSFKKT